jgi:hypothetical protein
MEPAGEPTVTMGAEIETIVGHGVPDERERTFSMSGTITYGPVGALTFSTAGTPLLSASPEPGAQLGAVILRVTGGAGQLAAAAGFITSNFQVHGNGERAEYHFVQVVVP